MLIALLVCLIPTTIGGLLSAIGIAGMDRVMQRNVLAMSGRAVEAAGDVDTLLLDKTGTITLGNRQAVEIISAAGVDAKDCARVWRISRRLPTKRRRGVRSSRSPQEGVAREARPAAATFVPFSAYTRMSGLDLADGTKIRKGAPDSVLGVGPRARAATPSAELAPARRTHRAQRRHAAAARAQRDGLGRDLPQGHPQAEHARSASTVFARWAFARS